MDEKSAGGQAEPEKEQWLFSGTTVAGLVGLLAPAACITIFFGHTGVFWDFLLTADFSKFRALSYDARGRHRLLVWIRNNVLMPLAYGANLTEADLWRDGSLLCSLINLLVPEACPRPQNHCDQRPSHGQTLAHKYLGIAPIFTDEEFAQETLTPQQEKEFFKYLSAVHQSFTQLTKQTHSMKFSTDYVSRGMGLVVAQQCQKSIFYIYSIPKHLHQQHPCDIELSIRGPYGCQGHIVVPSILHHKQRCQRPTDYRRSLYMTSKLNSISPTTQGTSFFRKLSVRESWKRVDPSQEIVIKVKLTETRAKVSYIPQKTGIYTVNLVTNGCHVIGSPYTVPVEQATGKTYLSNDSDTESEEETRTHFVRRKKRIISRIVDFVDEKMLLQQDGTLVKIDETKPSKSNDEAVQRKDDTMIKNTEMSKHDIDELKDDTFINEHELKLAQIDTHPNEEASNVTEEGNEAKIRVNSIIWEEIINEKEPEIFSEIKKNSAIEATILNDNLASITVILDRTYEENDSENNFIIISNGPSEGTENGIKMVTENETLSDTEINTNVNVQMEELLDIFPENGEETEDNLKTTDGIIQDSMFESYFHVEINENLQENQAEEHINIVENDLNFEITERFPKEPQEIEDIVNTYDTNNDSTANNCTLHGLNNNLLDAMDMNTSSVNYNKLQQRYTSITPDILEPSNNNSTVKSSETSTAFVDDCQTLKRKSFDPTSDSTEVQDPNLHRTPSVYEIMKTFSTKDPSKEESSLLGNYVNSQRNSSVNNLIKVFDGSRNDPDLVQCHGKPNEQCKFLEHYSDTSKCNEHTDDRLNRMGVILIDYDKRQRYLKSVLIYQLNNRFKRKLSASHRKYRNEAALLARTNPNKNDLISGGVVERQKRFWQEKFTGVNSENTITKHSLNFSIRSSAKPVTTCKEIVSSKSTRDTRRVQMQARPFDGLVRNTTQIFETKSVSCGSINQSTTKANGVPMQKCKSDGSIQDKVSQRFAQIPTVDKSYQYASIEDRKAQLLKAYSETTLSRCDNKNYIHQSRSDDQAMHQSESVPHDEETVSPTQVKQPDVQETPTTGGAQKLDQKTSFRRRARFTSAKLFFHHLERSQWKTNVDLSSETASSAELQFQRSESAPCLARQLNYTNHEVEEEEEDATVVDGNALPVKISDRFLVNDLFRDILGDSDKRFLGIPNKMAVVASLASLDSDSSKAEFDSVNEDEQQQQREPKRTKRRRIPGPGFHEEYPHPPMTERWMYRSRSNTDLAGLIPRRVLLGATTNQSKI